MTVTKYLGAIFALFIIIVDPMSAVAKSAVTVDSLKDLIAHELPIGSSQEQIMNFVSEQHLTDDAGGDGWYFSTPSSIFVVVRNAKRSWWFFYESRTDIQLLFSLDAMGKLKTYEVKENIYQR